MINHLSKFYKKSDNIAVYLISCSTRVQIIWVENCCALLLLTECFRWTICLGAGKRAPSLFAQQWIQRGAYIDLLYHVYVKFNFSNILNNQWNHSCLKVNIFDTLFTINWFQRECILAMWNVSEDFSWNYIFVRIDTNWYKIKHDLFLIKVYWKHFFTSDKQNHSFIFHTFVFW